MKNLLVYIWRLAGLIAVATGGGAELQRGAADTVTRTSPRMTCEFQDSVEVNSDSISVCTAGTEIVYRQQKVLSQTLSLSGEEAIELAAATIEECAKLAAEAGHAAFEFNSKCLAYSTSNRFTKCYILCSRVIYVTSHSFPKKALLVPLNEAPWKPGPYDDTREYRLEKLIYLDESNLPQPSDADQPYDPVRYRKGFNYAMLQNGSTFAFSNAYVDLSTCLYYDGDAGLPTLVSPIYFDHTLVIFHFLESCGNTIILPRSSTLDDQAKRPPSYIVVYSHRGYGCSEFPGKTSVDCTVNIEYDDAHFGHLDSLGLIGPDGGCDGFTFTEDTKRANEDICGFIYGLDTSGRTSLTLRGSASDTRLGFLIVFSYS